MKSKYSLVLVISLFLISSCSIEKRVYRGGYHIEWKNEKRTKLNSDHELETKDKELNMDISETDKIDHIPQIKARIISSAIEREKTLRETSKSDNTVLNVIVKNKVGQHLIYVNKTFQKIGGNQTENYSDVSVKKSNIDEPDVLKSEGETSGNKALRTIGWVILILGLLFLLVVSIIAGAILMLLGLVFVIAGGSKGNKEKKSKASNTDKGVLQDVVYLKNGSVLKGTIIEQIPNVSIKIELKDGSIFVVKQEEIEKISKEKMQ